MNRVRQPQLQERTSSEKEMELEKKRRRKEKAKQKKLVRRQKLLEKKQKLLRDHLTREIAYGRYTMKKHRIEWMRMLIEITLPRQKADLEFAWQNFERVIDAKDFTISCLMDEVRQAEDQYMMNLVEHIGTVDKMILTFRDQLAGLHSNFSDQLQFLKDQESAFIAEMERSSEESTHFMKAMIFRMEMENKDRERDLKAEICARTELANSRQDSILLELRGRLENLMEFMWQTTRDIIDNFQKKTRTRLTDYESLKASDDKVQELLSTELRKLNHLGKVIRKLRKKEDDINENNLPNLRTDMKFFRDAFLVLKQKLAADLKSDKRKQEILIVRFHDAFTKMKKILKQGENLMRLVRSSKRLETPDEKVRPYPLNLSNIRHGLEHSKDRKLFLFWQRMAKCDSSRSALMEEKVFLMQKNNLLIKEIKSMCICMSCPRLPPICRREGPVPFTDGLTLMRKYEMLYDARKR